MQGKYKIQITYIVLIIGFFSEIAGNISLIVNRTVEQINTTQLLYDQVDATYQQLLTQQASITNNTSQVSYSRPQ